MLKYSGSAPDVYPRGGRPTGVERTRARAAASKRSRPPARPGSGSGRRPRARRSGSWRWSPGRSPRSPPSTFACGRRRRCRCPCVHRGRKPDHIGQRGHAVDRHLLDPHVRRAAWRGRKHFVDVPAVAHGADVPERVRFRPRRKRFDRVPVAVPEKNVNARRMERLAVGRQQFVALGEAAAKHAVRLLDVVRAGLVERVFERRARGGVGFAASASA